MQKINGTRHTPQSCMHQPNAKEKNQNQIKQTKNNHQQQKTPHKTKQNLICFSCSLKYLKSNVEIGDG